MNAAAAVDDAGPGGVAAVVVAADATTTARLADIGADGKKRVESESATWLLRLAVEAKRLLICRRDVRRFRGERIEVARKAAADIAVISMDCLRNEIPQSDITAGKLIIVNINMTDAVSLQHMYRQL